jgi:hypothetical protein
MSRYFRRRWNVWRSSGLSPSRAVCVPTNPSATLTGDLLLGPVRVPSRLPYHRTVPVEPAMSSTVPSGAALRSCRLAG